MSPANNVVCFFSHQVIPALPTQQRIQSPEHARQVVMQLQQRLLADGQQGLAAAGLGDAALFSMKKGG